MTQPVDNDAFYCVNASLPECKHLRHPHIADPIVRIDTELKEIRATLDLVKETMLRADAAIANIAGQVMPTIEELSKSPLLKMLGMKK